MVGLRGLRASRLTLGASLAAGAPMPPAARSARSFRLSPFRWRRLAGALLAGVLSTLAPRLLLPRSNLLRLLPLTGLLGLTRGTLPLGPLALRLGAGLRYPSLRRLRALALLGTARLPTLCWRPLLLAALRLALRALRAGFTRAVARWPMPRPRARRLCGGGAPGGFATPFARRRLLL